MAAVAGPRTVTAGLVLNLDAANVGKTAALTSVQYLIVAGGGGGGGTGSGGAGAGGLLTGTTTITPQNYTITVGTGGNGGRSWNNQPRNGTNGGNSSAFGLTAIGGGATFRSANNPTGGSGGGADRSTQPGQGTAGQGNLGGFAPFANGQGTGGGGGAGSVGQDAVSAAIAGNGGSGLVSNITGTATFYAGGGGGGIYSTGGTYAAGLGGLGGGGDGGRTNVANTGDGARDAAPNTGGGGGGGGYTSSGVNLQGGGNGGSGIVVIRYPGPQRATGGTVTSVEGDTVHTFTTVGSSTFTPFTALTNGVAFAGVADLSGLNNVGTALGAPVYASGNQGVFTLDGVDDRIDCGNDASINFGTGDFTVSLWFRRFANATSNLRLLSKAAGGDGSTAASAGFCFFGGNTSVLFGINPTAPRTIIAAATYSLNEWVNVTGLLQRGVSVRTYKNANLTATATAPTGSVSGTTSLFIGDNVGANLRWAGEIAQVLLYNRALTQAEIAQNFEAQRGRFGI